MTRSRSEVDGDEKTPAPKPSKVPEENSKTIPGSPKDEAEVKEIAELCLLPEFKRRAADMRFRPELFRPAYGGHSGDGVLRGRRA